ncbi:hypothetical protein, partial [Pseudomonas carnis]|uniref:hypothetical protein n=1 Tax=Pseudomonas carnis TaxID=2487355 RepID=UPI001E41589B
RKKAMYKRKAKKQHGLEHRPVLTVSQPGVRCMTFFAAWGRARNPDVGAGLPAMVIGIYTNLVRR